MGEDATPEEREGDTQAGRPRARDRASGLGPDAVGLLLAHISSVGWQAVLTITPDIHRCRCALGCARRRPSARTTASLCSRSRGVVTQPRLVGPRLRGIPCDHDGFIHTDLHGRRAGIDGVVAAGDATTSPDEGREAQRPSRLDAVAGMTCGGLPIEPRSFHPILHGAPHGRTRASPARCPQRWSRRRLDDLRSGPVAATGQPCGTLPRPYHSRQVGDSADLIPQPRRVL
jgi:hypothetical protein